MVFGSATLLLSILATVSSLKSPASQYYRDLNCTTIQRAGAPTIYNCDHLNDLEEDKCYYKGKKYQLGEAITTDVIENPCIVHCICDKRDEYDMPSFTCVSIECPHLHHPLEEGCVNIYETGKCCPVRTHCEKENGPLPVCTFEGKTYKYGEHIYPNDEPCTKCICKEGFNGTLTEPFCEKINCELYLHYFDYIRDGCVPTYYTPDDCCPIPQWRCPSDSDSIVKPQPVAPKIQESICKFGKLELKVGQKLSKIESEKCVDCACDVPPHVSCVMNTTCYESSDYRS